MNTLAGTGPLLRLIVRRDRVVMPAWVIVLSLLPMIVARALGQLYPTVSEIMIAARDIGGNPAFTALFGPVFSPTIGGLTAWRASIVFVVIGLASLLAVIRHTRVDEETGRRELIGSTVVGRHAPLTAAVIAVVGANFVAAMITAGGLVAAGQPRAGSVAFALALASSGVVFTAVGALAAQLTESSGGARAIGLAVLGLSFVLRAAGDASGGPAGSTWPSWLSPIGWAMQVRAFADTRWWVLGVATAFAVVLVTSAYVLEGRRDIGAGVVAPRLGPARAAPRLASPLALAWRLQRGLLVGWAVGFAVLGAIYGSVAEGVGKLLVDNPNLAAIFERLGGSRFITDAYLAGISGVLGLIAAAYGIQATGKLRSEEETLRAEPVLATSISKVEWMGSHLVFGFIGPVIALLTGGFAVGVTYGIAAGDVSRQLPRVVAAALVQAPAVWVVVAIAAASFGLAARFVSAAWSIYAGFVLVTILGAVLQLSHWILDLSPFIHIPKLPGSRLLMTPLFILCALVVAITSFGVSGFRRRDVT